MGYGMTNGIHTEESLACPVCRRVCTESDPPPVCRRCGADLGLYRDTAFHAQTLLRQAAAHLRTSPQTARQLANRSVRLHATAAGCRMQALAALCARDYPAALAYYAKARPSP